MDKRPLAIWGGTGSIGLALILYWLQIKVPSAAVDLLGVAGCALLLYALFGKIYEKLGAPHLALRWPLRWPIDSVAVEIDSQFARVAERSAPPAAKPSRITLIHDNVEWEDRGTSTWVSGKHVSVAGPFCPVDHTPLHNDGVSQVSKYQPLRCPECSECYLLSDEGKYVTASEAEVRSRFEGQRLRNGTF